MDSTSLLSAFFLAPLLFAFTPIYVWICSLIGDSCYVFRLIQTVFAFLLVLAPTILMGGTLPVLSRFAVNIRDNMGKTVGRLYTVNTLGAATGCFAAGFFLIGTFGLRETTHLTMLTNIAIAAAAFILSRKESTLDMSRDQPLIGPAAENPSTQKFRCITVHSENEKKRSSVNLMIWIIGLSGFTGLAYEVLWTRLLVFFSPSTMIYSFSTMLTVFLFAFTLGSYLGSHLADKSYVIEALICIEGLVALAGLLTVPFIAELPVFSEIIRGYTLIVTDPFRRNVLSFALCSAAIMFIPSLLLGAVFPMAAKIYTDDLAKVGHGVAQV